MVDEEFCRHICDELSCLHIKHMLLEQGLIDYCNCEDECEDYDDEYNDDEYEYVIIEDYDDEY